MADTIIAASAVEVVDEAWHEQQRRRDEKNRNPSTTRLDAAHIVGARLIWKPHTIGYHTHPARPIGREADWEAPVGQAGEGFLPLYGWWPTLVGVLALFRPTLACAQRRRIT